jgi:hypothetical protein
MCRRLKERKKMPTLAKGQVIFLEKKVYLTFQKKDKFLKTLFLD